MATHAKCWRTPRSHLGHLVVFQSHGRFLSFFSSLRLSLQNTSLSTVLTTHIFKCAVKIRTCCASLRASPIFPALSLNFSFSFSKASILALVLFSCSSRFIFSPVTAALSACSVFFVSSRVLMDDFRRSTSFSLLSAVRPMLDASPLTERSSP